MRARWRGPAAEGDGMIKSFVTFAVVFGLLTYFSTYFEDDERRPRWWAWTLGLALAATLITGLF